MIINDANNVDKIQPEPLAAYNKFSALLEKMIKLAKLEHWDEITLLQTEYQALVKALPDFSSQTEISDDFKIVAREVIKRVIDQDHELMSLIKAKHSKVGNSMTSLNTQHKVHTAYTKFSDQGIEKQMLRDL